MNITNMFLPCRYDINNNGSMSREELAQLVAHLLQVLMCLMVIGHDDHSDHGDHGDGDDGENGDLLQVVMRCKA